MRTLVTAFQKAQMTKHVGKSDIVKYSGTVCPLLLEDQERRRILGKLAPTFCNFSAASFPQPPPPLPLLICTHTGDPVTCVQIPADVFFFSSDKIS